MSFNRRSAYPNAPVSQTGRVIPERGANLLLGAALMLSLVLAGLTVGRMIRVERDLQPALEDGRRLSALLEAARVQLRDSRLGTLEARTTRADSLAQRFHRLAAAPRPSADQRALMVGYDAAFGQFYVAARRAAAGISMSDDADGSSAEDATLGHELVRERLARGMQSQSRGIEAARPGTAPVELAAWLSLGMLVAAALIRRVADARQPVSTKPRTDTHPVVRPTNDTPVIPLGDAVARLARQRLAASVAAAKVARRNNEKQIELAQTWNVPLLTIVPAEQPMGEMDVYEDEGSDDEQAAPAPIFQRLALVTA
jgi:hypothetical protein